MRSNNVHAIERARRTDLRVLVITGHPRSASLCAALADAYADGARAVGLRVRQIDLSLLRFDPDVHTPSPLAQPLEPDLAQAWESIVWADHLLFAFPAWWGVGPAKLYGFLDRMLLPGLAFREREGRFEGLLAGKTAHLITTMDMPPWVYKLIYRAPGHGALKRSILGFCGIATTRTLAFGPVKDSDQTQRAAWLAKANQMGQSLSDGARSKGGQAARALLSWVKALRLQFYPMTWMAYTVGALGAASSPDWLRYWLGYGFLFCAEAATVFSNEWFDFESDRRNQHHGPFNGGSRVLVQGNLSFRQIATGIGVALMLAVVCVWLLAAGAAGGAPSAALLLMLLLALGYTVPPLKLSWRGLGELDVGITHSIGVVICGYLLQGGGWRDPFPWLVSLPMFLSILPSIILAGFPDLEADRQAGKRTLATRLGHRGTLLLAIIPALAAPVAVLLVKDAPALGGSLDGVLPWAALHALLLTVLLWRGRRTGGGRVDLLLVAALTYIMWFVVIPLLHMS
jgi:putative NADPH-quinone reductase/1,4-dihydroxy-2-naphthoate octaprenyltransferase